jgi:hypothetical protein
VTPFSEFIEVSASDLLQQGDVLEAVDPLASKWTRHLLVITADCDLKYEKHHGRVTCVPILTTSDYLLEMHFPKVKERTAAKAFELIRKALDSVGVLNTTDARLREWLVASEPRQVADEFAFSEEMRELFVGGAATVKRLQEEADSVDGMLRLLAESAALLEPKRKSDGIDRELVTGARQVFSSTPGDAQFLGAFTPHHRDGYFVYLRQLEQLWEADIRLVAPSPSATHRRIGRLSDRMTMAIVQRFALVFMAIGLPTDYEDMRQLHAETIGETTL